MGTMLGGTTTGASGGGVRGVESPLNMWYIDGGSRVVIKRAKEYLSG